MATGQTVSDKDAILRLVPIGEENAVPGRLIWEQYGLWSPSGIRRKLNDMAAKGLIERKKLVLFGTRDKSLYFRTTPAGSL